MPAEQRGSCGIPYVSLDAAEKKREIGCSDHCPRKWMAFFSCEADDRMGSPRLQQSRYNVGDQSLRAEEYEMAEDPVLLRGLVERVRRRNRLPVT